jgi:Holliday junction DNA helicase RuvB
VDEEEMPVRMHEERMSKPGVETLTDIKPEPLFESIVGYTDIKKLFQMSLSSDKPVHILLVGPPASAKTLFMLECLRLERYFFSLGIHSIKSGLIYFLFDKRPL